MYRKFYKFSAKPFALTPDLKFLFRSDGHKRALSYLHYGLEQAEGFVIITGDIGCGKTMLIQALLEDLKTQEIATARVAAANLDKDEIIPMVAAALKQPYEGKSKTAIIRDLERSLRRAREYLKGVLLIVDEAQTLTPEALEELRILSNLESNGSALIQIFLIGQVDFRETIMLPSMEPLRQRTVASYNLEPLTRAELKRYVGFRLLAVGWEGDPVIDDEVYDIAHRFTDGVPRKINIFMDRFFVYGFIEEIRHFTREHALKVATELSGELAGDFIDRSTDIGDEPNQQSGESSEIKFGSSAKDSKDEDDDADSSKPRRTVARKKKKPGKSRKNNAGNKHKERKSPSNSWEVIEDSQESDDNTLSTPLERRLRDLDKKLEDLSGKTRNAK